MNSQNPMCVLTYVDTTQETFTPVSIFNHEIYGRFTDKSNAYGTLVNEIVRDVKHKRISTFVNRQLINNLEVIDGKITSSALNQDISEISLNHESAMLNVMVNNLVTPEGLHMNVSDLIRLRSKDTIDVLTKSGERVEIKLTRKPFSHHSYINSVTTRSTFDGGIMEYSEPRSYDGNVIYIPITKESFASVSGEKIVGMVNLDVNYQRVDSRVLNLIRMIFTSTFVYRFGSGKLKGKRYTFSPLYKIQK